MTSKNSNENMKNRVQPKFFLTTGTVKIDLSSHTSRTGCFNVQNYFEKDQEAVNGVDESPTPLELWAKYADILWEEGHYKKLCKAFIEEIDLIFKTKNISIDDRNIMDKLVPVLRQKDNKNSTINRKIAPLSKLVRKHHHVNGINAFSSLGKLREPNGRIRFLTGYEEQLLLQVIGQKNQSLSNITLFLLETGARVGEALKLRWTDISGNSATFWETKNATPRTVPLTREAQKLLEKQRRLYPHNGPFSAISYSRFNYAWNRARKLMGLEHDDQFVPHCLRHTCASRLAQQGVDIKRIQEFLGHKTLTMTLRYAHLLPDHLDVCKLALEDNRSDFDQQAIPHP